MLLRPASFKHTRLKHNDEDVSPPANDAAAAGVAQYSDDTAWGVLTPHDLQTSLDALASRSRELGLTLNLGKGKTQVLVVPGASSNVDCSLHLQADDLEPLITDENRSLWLWRRTPREERTPRGRLRQEHSAWQWGECPQRR